MGEIHKGPFGSCCEDLADCMRQQNPMIGINDNGKLFMSIGFIQTDEGVGWFDQAIIYCPICGKKLQNPKDLG